VAFTARVVLLTAILALIIGAVWTTMSSGQPREQYMAVETGCKAAVDREAGALRAALVKNPTLATKLANVGAGAITLPTATDNEILYTRAGTGMPATQPIKMTPTRSTADDAIIITGTYANWKGNDNSPEASCTSVVPLVGVNLPDNGPTLVGPQTPPPTIAPPPPYVPTPPPTSAPTP